MLSVSLHIDPAKLKKVCLGDLDFRTCVGQVRMENPATGNVEWMNAYVHFEFEGGAPRLTNGKVRLNCRPQKDQRASRGISNQESFDYSDR